MKDQKPERTKVKISLDFNEARAIRDLILSANSGFFQSLKAISKELTEDFQTDRTLTNGIHSALYGGEKLKKENTCKK
tara:strand:+ start:1755 stop:1988 length:234 start_codon:yes stop_codon:yes gene_type:complete